MALEPSGKFQMNFNWYSHMWLVAPNNTELDTRLADGSLSP